MWCYKVPYGVSKAETVQIYQKMLYSPVLAPFADSTFCDHIILSINREYCVSCSIYGMYVCAHVL